MTARHVAFAALFCDGCGAELGLLRPGADAVRAAAAAAGWTFPPKVTASGGWSTRRSDVCPDCTPGWKARPALRRPDAEATR